MASRCWPCPTSGIASVLSCTAFQTGTPNLLVEGLALQTPHACSSAYTAPGCSVQTLSFLLKVDPGLILHVWMGFQGNPASSSYRAGPPLGWPWWRGCRELSWACFRGGGVATEWLPSGSWKPWLPREQPVCRAGVGGGQLPGPGAGNPPLEIRTLASPPRDIPSSRPC